MKASQPLSMSKLIVVSLSLAGLGGCASTSAPVVYPKGKAANEQRTTADLSACQAEAAAVVGVNSKPTQRDGTRVAQLGAIEFVDKAVESMVNGSRGAMARARGAGAGAMAGTVTQIALNWNEPDAVYRNYVDQCLKERGHKVLGWR